jgi:rubredoxin
MMNAVKNSYPNGECPDCGENIPDDVQSGEECANCGHVFGEEQSEPDDSMDGDHQSGLASAGFGTDEDYEHNLCDE